MSNSSTLLDTIATNQSNKEVVANALFDAASPAMLFGRHASACSGLTWGYYGGQFGSNAIANGTVTLTASTTNYVQANPTTGVVSANSTGFTSGYVELYTIVTGATTVTSYTDLRQSGTGSGGSATLSGLSDVNVTEGAPINGYALVWNNATSKWVAASIGGTVPFNLISYYPGAPTASAVLLSATTPQAATFPASLTGSYAYCDTAATAAVVLPIQQYHSGSWTTIGSVNFAIGATTGTFTFSAAITTAAGDRIRVLNQTSPDATFAGPDIALAASI